MSLIDRDKSAILYSEDHADSDPDDPDYLDSRTGSDADNVDSESESSSQIEPVTHNSLQLNQRPLHPPVITPAISTASRMRGRPRKLAPTFASVPDLPSVQNQTSDGSESACSGRPASRTFRVRSVCPISLSQSRAIFAPVATILRRILWQVSTFPP